MLIRGHRCLCSCPRFNVSFCTYLGATFDASTTNLTYHIPAPRTLKSTQPLEIIISFLSPITPTSTLRQSIPASYMTVHVSGGFNVDIYVDVNGQWASGDRGSRIVWDFDQQQIGGDKALKTWKIRRETEELFSEVRDQAEWGTLHFSAPSVGPSSRLPFFLRLTVARMSVTNLGPLDSYAQGLRELVPSKTPLTKTSAESWKKSPSLHSRSLSV